MKALIAIATALLTAACNTAHWEQENGASVVRYDMGGYIHDRTAQIQNLQRTGEKVRISGTCASSCTMLLVLPNACVDPDARMRFHGPGYKDRSPMPKWHHDETSAGMAKHYPPMLADWFMRYGRHVPMSEFHDMSGAQVIAMGAKSC